MVTSVRISRVHAASAAITIRNVVPSFLPLILYGSIVLKAGSDPVFELRMLGDEFHLADGQPLIERLPIRARVGRAEDAAVASDVDHVGVGGAEGHRVLIGMDGIAAG